MNSRWSLKRDDGIARALPLFRRVQDANEYNFTAKDAVRGDQDDSVKLDEHVGHTVKITGVVANATAHGMKEDTKEEMKEHGMDTHAERAT